MELKIKVLSFDKLHKAYEALKCVLTPQPLGTVWYCFHPWCLAGHVGGKVGGEK